MSNPEFRLNPVTGEWVIIAPQRSLRPEEYSRAGRRRRPPPPLLKSCPFCPGNEHLTPPPVWEAPRPRGEKGWQIRAFPNKYPALTPQPRPQGEPQGPLFLSAGAWGLHEVLVETPIHNRFPASRDAAEMALLVRAYRERFLAVRSQGWARYLVIFKNQGADAGTSIEHPHSQIMATPLVPETVRRRGALARRHLRRTGRCLHCQIAEEEMRDGARIVYRNKSFVVFHPFAAAHPAETWIVPLEHRSSFAHISEAEERRLAEALGRTLRQLCHAFSDPDFNYVIHSAPLAEEGVPFHHWHLQLIPRLTRAAGFELASGVFINVAPPEETAERMRQAPA